MLALILIGGLSSRMGRDKAGILRPDGRRQIDHLAAIARTAGLEPLLSMRDGSPPPLDLPVLIDRHPGGGPLAALAGFHHSRPAEPVLVIGGDLFLLDALTLRHLLAHRDPKRAATCFANRLDGQPEPLCALYEAGTLAPAAEWLARGDYKVRHFLRALDPQVLNLPHSAALDNVNSPLDLDEAFAKLAHGVTPKTVTVEHPAFVGPIETLACTIGGIFAELCFQLRLELISSGHHVHLNGQRALWNSLVAQDDAVAFLSEESARSPELDGESRKG